MPPSEKVDLSQIRNKIVRGQLLKKQKRDKNQAKLKRRIARKEAEQRGETVERGHTRTIEQTACTVYEGVFGGIAGVARGNKESGYCTEEES
ncbi:hypothetical protein BCR35DRAFT_136018 [Leucosporidium creatinivorum]|uniref:Uncharacterized protein n=1 Tax=Leucosporidium creatinivorum TaxID=106004 RepID=A0A1Y2G0T9_9BASI|nr:hypothetical protein BCR35DRAFT_136018 [Leucosporidium creatinivorum]